MEDLGACYAALELEDGASADAVDRAYRELSRVWHPDRFAGDNPSLQERARQKQGEINTAYERLVAARRQAADVPVIAPDRPLAQQTSGVTAPADPGVAAPVGRSALSQVGQLVIDHLVPVLRTAVLPAILRRLASGRGAAGRTADGALRPRRNRDGRGAGRGDGQGRRDCGSSRGGKGRRGRRR